MKVTYDDKYDLLYLELDDTAERVRNEDVADGIVLGVTRMAGSLASKSSARRGT